MLLAVSYFLNYYEVYFTTHECENCFKVNPTPVSFSVVLFMFLRMSTCQTTCPCLNCLAGYQVRDVVQIYKFSNAN